MKTATISMIAVGALALVTAASMLRSPPIVRSPVSAPAATSGEQLCRAGLKRFVTFKDPDSVRVNSVEANPDRPGRYLMSVSAKNSFGGYGDPTACTCGTANGAVTDMHCDGAGG